MENNNIGLRRRLAFVLLQLIPDDFCRFGVQCSPVRILVEQKHAQY